jgi:hypothetical protein
MMFSTKHFNRMKRLLTVAITLFFAQFALAQAPANDNCSGAITLTPIALGGSCPTTVYTNVNATDAPAIGGLNPTCFNGLRAFKDVWFKFTTPSSTSGNNINYRVTVKGVSAVDSIRNPQVAMYIGDCNTGLFEEYCATREVANDTNAVRLDAGCMRANTTYFIQVASYLSTDIGGRFTVCIEPIDPVYRMQVFPQTTTACVGTVYDSGGPTGNYGNNENNRLFNIRPTATGCIELTIKELNTEANVDTLVVIDGRTGNVLDRLSGAHDKLPLVITYRTDWIQLRFKSDISIVGRGFEVSWRSLITCNIPSPTTCGSPELIQRLPFSRLNQTTCHDALNTVTTSPCSTPATVNNFLQGKDHVYKFTSAGAQCISVLLTGMVTANLPGTHTGTNIGIYFGCPGTAGSVCIGNGRVNATRDSVQIANIQLDVPGDYYFVVSRREACTPYNIQIDTVPCLNRLPNAGSCDRALSLNDCSNTNPSDIILDLSVRGDSTFFTPGAPNAGCISSLNGTRFNFVFLSFQAKANGKFGFNISSIVPDPNFDIDFNFYGPIDNPAQICNFVKNNAPLRSSYGVGTLVPSRAQGMADVYTNTLGLPITVTDTCEGIGGTGVFDGVVKRADVQQGKYYVLWINDFFGSVGRNGVRMNFRGTDNGVLNNGIVENFTAGRDTFICRGGTTSMTATGGISYKWTPASGLNRDTGAVVTASPSTTTRYTVLIQGTCQQVAKQVNVGVFNIKNIADQTVCRGEELNFDAGETYPAATGATWAWTSPSGNLSALSCTNCPNPSFRAINATGSNQVQRFIVTLTSPNCTIRDTVDITVTTGNVPQYQVITGTKLTRDTNVCIGSTFNLLRGGFDASATYTWVSSPSSTLTGSNPLISPTSSIVYYVTVTGGSGGCTAQSRDSVIVNVFTPPTLSRTIRDTSLCRDAQLVLGRTIVQANTTYSWSNVAGLSATNSPNPTLTVQPGANRYILTASNPGNCVTRDTYNITGINIAIRIDTVDSIRICRGTPLTLRTFTTPLGAKANWVSNRDFGLPTDSVTAVTVNPNTRTTYVATLSAPGCTRKDTVTVYVDSLPQDRRILPQDTTVCKGTLILLRSPVFEPIFFPGIQFKWAPANGAITPDSLYNLVLSADTTTTYRRTATNGVCRIVDSTKVNVTPLPILTIFPRDTIICEGTGLNNITLNAFGNNPLIRDWKWQGPNGPVPNSDNRTSISVTLIQGPNQFTVTAKLGDCPGSASTTITLAPAPRVQFPSNPVVCKDSSVVLNLAPNASNTYSWTGPNGYTSNLPAPSVAVTASGRYAVTVTGTNRCSSSAFIDLVASTATLTATGDTSVCSGNPLSLTATGTSVPAGGSYLWSTGGTTATISPSSSVSGTYSVTFTYGNNCRLSRSVRVTSVPGFNLRISPDTFRLDRLLDQGTPLTLNAIVSGNAPGATYAWTEGTNNLGTSQSISIRPINNDPTYRVTVNSTTGCRKDTAIKIYLRYPNYGLPNAFTPNGDTINSFFGLIFNDKFPPANTDQRPRFWKGRIEVTSFQVFNRWGTEVYSETNASVLNGATYKGWDGRKKSEDAASDVYVYLIKLKMPDDSIRVESGELNLIR